MVLLVIHLIILVLCLTLRITECSYSAISFFFVLSSSISFVIYVLKMRNVEKSFKLIIVSSFILRVLLVVVDVFISRLPEAGYDDESYYQTSLRLFNDNYAGLAGNVYGGFFSKILAVSYYFIGPSRFSAQYLNVLFYGIAIILFMRALIYFAVSQKKSKVCMLLMCFLPTAILHNSILRRETVIELCVCASIFFLSKWHANKRSSDSLWSIAFALFAGIFHTAFIFSPLILSLYYVLYDKNKLSASFSVKNSSKMAIVLVLLVIAGTSFLSLFANKFSYVDSMDDIYTATNRARGGSVYLAGYQVNNFGQLILFTPLKLFYFLFSPVPWMFRNAMDIISFFFDAMIYLTLLIKVVRREKTSITRLMLTEFIVLSIVFALGTYNSGTAIRHRFSVLPYLLVAYSLAKKRIRDGNVSKKDKKLTTSNIDNKERRLI